MLPLLPLLPQLWQRGTPSLATLLPLLPLLPLKNSTPRQNSEIGKKICPQKKCGYYASYYPQKNCGYYVLLLCRPLLHIKIYINIGVSGYTAT
jgi:hypothetical protein